MAKEVEVDLKVDSTAADKALKKFGGTLEDVHGEGVQPLNFAIGELEDRLYEMAAAGDTGTKEFKEMSAEVGRMKKVIIDTDLAVDGMAQTMAQNVGGALSGIAGGFELAQGAMGAFGMSGEAVEESLLKVQSAMAMAQGIQGLKEGMAAFKGLRSSIMATTVVQKALNFVMNMNPIGMIITGVVALGAAIAALWGPIKKMLGFFGLMNNEAAEAEEARIEADKKATEAHENRVKAIEKEIEANKRAAELAKRKHKLIEREIALEIRRAKQAGKTAAEIAALEDKAHQQKLDGLATDLETETKDKLATVKKLESRAKLLADLAKNQKKGSALQKKYHDLSVNLAEGASKMRTAILNNELDGQKEILLETEEAEQDNEDKEADRIERRRERYKKLKQDRLNALRQIQDLETELMRDSTERELEANRLKYERLIEDTKTSEKNEEEKLKLIELYTRLEGEKRLEIGNQYLENKLELNDLELKGTEELEIKKTAVTKYYAEERKKFDKEVFDAGVETANTSFQAIGDLANAFAGDNEKSQKRAFNINKAVQMAQAVISTYQGANAIFASAAANPATVAFPAQPFIMAGAAIASGLANVATIAKTKFQGGGGSPSGGGRGGSAPSLPSGGGSPTFNVIGDSGTNQLAESLGEPMKAYVVSNDVTTAQSLDRNKIENASI